MKKKFHAHEQDTRIIITYYKQMARVLIFQIKTKQNILNNYEKFVWPCNSKLKEI